MVLDQSVTRITKSSKEPRTCDKKYQAEKRSLRKGYHSQKNGQRNATEHGNRKGSISPDGPDSERLRRSKKQRQPPLRY